MGLSTHTKSLDAPRQFPNYVLPPRLRTNLRLHARKRRNYITFPSACGREDVFLIGLTGLGARRFLTQRHGKVCFNAKDAKIFRCFMRAEPQSSQRVINSEVRKIRSTNVSLGFAKLQPHLLIPSND